MESGTNVSYILVLAFVAKINYKSEEIGSC